jgi:5'(3')-deoxyribonucleotidase
MICLVDVDGVLADFVGSFLRCYSDLGGDIPRGFEWWEWNDYLDLPDGDAIDGAWKHEWLFNTFLDPYPGAMQALRRLNARHEVYLVTSIASPWETHVPARTKWLRRHAPFLDIRNQVIVANQKGIVQGDVLVDDYLENIRSWRAWNPKGRAVVIDHPWNEGPTWCERASSFEAFVDQLHRTPLIGGGR